MLVRPRQPLDALSISALDLFASALGAFMLLAVSFFPYYLRSPALETEREGARAELTAAAQALSAAERAEADAEKEKTEAEAVLARAQERLRRSQAAAAAALEAAERPHVSTPPNPVEQPVPGLHRVHLAIVDLDLVFVMDTTGSMRDELEDLQASLVGIIRVLHRLAPSLRVGFVAYRDRGDAYVVRGFPLSPMDDDHEARILAFVRALSAQGGGDPPERVDEGLDAAVGMPWRSSAQGRIVVIGDTPAHPAEIEKTVALAARFRTSLPDARWPRTVSAIFTGNDAVAKAFFARLAEAGGGDFSVHKGRMIESVLLSVLGGPPAASASR